MPSAPSIPAFRFRPSLRRPALHAVQAGLFAAVIALLIPDQYRSEARILSDTGHAGGGNGLRAGVWAPSAAPETPGSREDGPTVIYVDVLRSRSLAEQLLLGPYDYHVRSWRFGRPRPVRGTLMEYLGARNLDRGMGALRDMLAVQRDLKSGLLTIRVETRDPGLSMAVVRRATAGLGTIVGELSRTAAVNKARFTQARLDEVNGRYRTLGQAFQRFQDGNRNWERSPAPNIRFQGNQLREELELWRQVVANLTLNHEQALLEAQNDTQTLLLMDPGNLPVEKSKPARALMVFVAMCAAGLGSWVYLNRAMVYDRFIAKETSS
jgi:uncharacterized protein involved in exopolysaccharide biosynthesis